MRFKISATFLIMFFVCGIASASEGGEPAAAPSIFSGTFADSLWTVIAFGLLLVILGKFAWKPMLSGLHTREKYIQDQIETADSSRKKAEQLLEEHQQRALQIITDATKQAQKEAESLTEKARQEVQDIRLRAQEDIKQARIAASEQLWQEAGDIVLALGSEVLERAVTPQDNQRLIDDAVLKLRQKKNG